MRPIRVAVVDDHTLVIEAVRLALREVDDIEVVGDATSGWDLLRLVSGVQVDVVLLDLRMPGMDGFACLDHLQKRNPQIKVIVLSAADDPRLINESLRRGACAYVVKTCDPTDLACAIRFAKEPSIFTGLLPSGSESELDRLTRRERDVLAAVARGLSNRQIARELSLSEQTVKFHLTNIYRKLGITNRTEAARIGYRHGVATPPVASTA